MKKHSPNTAKKYNHDGYFCKNTVQIKTAMGTFVKTRSKWTNTGEFPLTCLLVAARLQISSEEYPENYVDTFTNFPPPFKKINSAYLACWTADLSLSCFSSFWVLISFSDWRWVLAVSLSSTKSLLQVGHLLLSPGPRQVLSLTQFCSVSPV